MSFAHVFEGVFVCVFVCSVQQPLNDPFQSILETRVLFPYRLFQPSFSLKVAVNKDRQTVHTEPTAEALISVAH